MLEGGHLAEDDVLVLDGEVFREDVVGAADDEFVDKVGKLSEFFVTFLAVFFGAVCVSPTEDGYLILLAEFSAGAEIVGVGKVEEGEVFREIVLNRCTRENYSSVDIESVECCKCLTLSVLQSMALITQHQSNRCIRQLSNIQPQRLIRNNKNRTNHSSSGCNGPLLQLRRHLGLCSLPVNSERIDCILTQPFHQFVCPIPDEGRRTSNDAFLDC